MATTGKITLPNGGKYEGEIANGEPNGKGVVKFDDGTIFEGTFIDGVPNGKCKRTSTDGETFEGTFRNGCPHGKCRCTLANGNYLESMYDEGEPVDGIDKCRFKYPDGSYYEGECINGNLKPDGWGTKVDSDGSRYEGEWRNGELHGYFIEEISDASAALIRRQVGWRGEGIRTKDVLRYWWIRTGADSNNGKPEVIRASDKNFDIPQEDYDTLGIKARLFIGFIEMWRELDVPDNLLSQSIDAKGESYYNWLVEKIQAAKSEEDYATLARKFNAIREYKDCAALADRCKQRIK
jgi:hypothetical protein